MRPNTTVGLVQRFIIEDFEQAGEHIVLKNLILFRQHAFQRFIVGFDQFHSLDDSLPLALILRQIQQVVVPGLLLQKQSALPHKIILGQRAHYAAPAGQHLFHGLLDFQETIEGMTQKNEAEIGI